jgi:hypothetical protein
MFNVGDTVTNGFTTYVIVDTEGTEDGDYRVKSLDNNVTITGWFHKSLFTLVTSAGPPPSKLTGMTQFFKDMKEKEHECF